VTCSYIAGTDEFLAEAIWYTTRRRRCQAPALRRARRPERGWPRLVVCRSTFPPLSPPHANSFVIGTAVINTHTQGTDAPQAFRRGEHMSRVGFDPLFSPGIACHPFLTLSATSLSLQGGPANIGMCQKVMIPARPLYKGVRESVWDPEHSP